MTTKRFEVGKTYMTKTDINVGRLVVMERWNYPDVTGRVIAASIDGKLWLIETAPGKTRLMARTSFLWTPDATRKGK